MTIFETGLARGFYVVFMNLRTSEECVVAKRFEIYEEAEEFISHDEELKKQCAYIKEVK